MSTVHLYSIFDKHAEEYGPIYEAVNDKVAARAYYQLMRTTPWPEDFILRRLAIFDRSEGKITPLSCVMDIPVSLPKELKEYIDEQSKNI